MKRRIFILTALTALAIPLFSGSAQDTPVVDKNVKELNWCKITAPHSAPAEDPVEAKIEVLGEVVEVNSKLHMELHKFVADQRVPGAGRLNPVAVKAGVDMEHTAKFKVPDDADSVVFVFYIVPEGESGFEYATHKGNVKVAIVR